MRRSVDVTATESPPLRTIEDGRGGYFAVLEQGSATTPCRFRMRLPKGGGPPSPEKHVHQSEHFRVLHGTLELGKIDGRRVVLRAGETLTLAPDTFHHPGNRYPEPVVFEALLTPGLDSCRMFEALYTAMRDNKGLAGMLRAALIFDRHRREITFPAPVHVGLALMARIARFVRAPAG